MRALRITIHLTLALAILSAGLPLYHPGDADRSGGIDLTDVIVSVRQLVRAADDETAFSAGMENTLTALLVAADLKKMIRTDRERLGGSNVPGAPVLAIIPTHDQEVLPAAAAPIAGRAFLYTPPSLTPLTPPPVSRLL